MKKYAFKKTGILAIAAIFFFTWGSSIAADKGPVELSEDVDAWYREALVYYQKGRYEEAQKRLTDITETVESNVMVQLWRENTHAVPRLDEVRSLLKDVQAHLDLENDKQFEITDNEAFKAAQLAAQEETRKASEREQAMLEAQKEVERRLREAGLQEQRQQRLKEEEVRASQLEQERQAREEELARIKAEQEQRRQILLQQAEERRQAREEELARLKEERHKRREMMLARREEERQRRIEERQRLIEERQAKRELAMQEREAALQEKEADIARRKEAAEQEAAEQEAARLARLEEEKKREEELRVQAEAERQARLAAEKQREEELRAQAEAERQAHEEEIARKQKEAEELAAKREAQRLARLEEEKQREQALRAQSEAERQAREEEIARKKKEAEELAAKREAQRLARLEEQKMRLAKSQAAAAVKDTPKANPPAIDDEIRSLELAVASMKQAAQKEKPAPSVVEADKDPERAIIRIEDMSKEIYYKKLLDEQRMRQVLAEQHEREQLSEQQRMQQEHILEEKRLSRIQQIEGERRAHEEARLARLREKEEIRQARIAEKEKRRQEEQGQAQKQQVLDSRQAKVAKQLEDAAKIRKIERIWRESRRMYGLGLFEEAIKGFRDVIVLEGNPRIKYTPEAKRLITEAEQKIIERDRARERLQTTNQINKSESDMVQSIMERQVTPYVDPPQKIVEDDEETLIEPPVIRKKLKEKRVTMDFDKVSLKSVMRFLSQESGINFVASQNVLNNDPVVTVRFTDATLDEVIKYITKSLGLVHRIDKDVIWIADPEEISNEAMETRVYYLRKGGGLFTDFTPVSGGGDTGLGGSSANINQIYTIEDTLKEMVPWPGDAKLTYDKRLNALIVRNTPQNLQMLEEIIYNLDIEPCQILIEARFVEIELTDVDDLGFEWKLVNENFAFQEEGGEFKWGLQQGSGIDFAAFTRAAEGLNLTYAGVLTQPQFEVVIHALQENKKVKTLSSPRITTLNNQMASIKVVDEWIYPTRYEFEVVQSDINGDGDFDDAGETVYQNVPKDFLRRDVGILLKVIPAVGSDRKTISLSLIPEVSEATANFFTFTGDVSLPKFTSRNLATSIVVNSSDTVVLGGLISENRTEIETRVPILGSIPFIGGLFRKNTDDVTRKNLLIFVTAKVLNSSGEEVVVQQK